MKNNFDETSTTSDEMPVKNSERRIGRKILKANGDLSRHHSRHGRKLKGKKHEHSRIAANNIQRFNNTATVLRYSGLLQITKTICQLENENKTIQTEIDKLQQETKDHSMLLQRQLQMKLEAENESTGSCNPEGHKLLSKLSQSLLQWD